MPSKRGTFLADSMPRDKGSQPYVVCFATQYDDLACDEPYLESVVEPMAKRLRALNYSVGVRSAGSWKNELTGHNQIEFVVLRDIPVGGENLLKTCNVLVIPYWYPPVLLEEGSNALADFFDIQAKCMEIARKHKDMIVLLHMQMSTSHSSEPDPHASRLIEEERVWIVWSDEWWMWRNVLVPMLTDSSSRML